MAQQYEPLVIASGLNDDVIANGENTALASTTSGVDNVDYAFMSADFGTANPSYALPVDGVITSGVTTGLTFQLADYSGNNSFRINGDDSTPLNSGTLTFTNQVAAQKIYLLTTSGSGSSVITTVINFTDDTSQTITGSNVPDWFNSSSLPIAASGFGRVLITNNAIENPFNNPRMYQLALEIDAENQTKLIESIEVTKTSSGEGAVNVFAVSAELFVPCAEPENLEVSSAITGATITWDEPETITPEEGYDYYYSTSADAPTADTVPTGSVDTDTDTLELDELMEAQMYYFWIRSDCGGDNISDWTSITFTTGESGNTNNDGDIATAFNMMPTVTSATDCAGTLTISVPDGYQISEVATAYSMTAVDEGLQSHQRSLLVCTTTSTTEADVTAGTDNSAGTQMYSRSGLTFANGATDGVAFELRAWRTFGGADCNTDYNKVDDGSWTVTATYECVTPVTPQAENQTFCESATVADLDADTDYDNATLRWYNVAEGGEPLEATTMVESGMYYVSQYRYTCESERQAVEVTVVTLTAPVAEPTQTLCIDATVADLSVTPSDGGTIAWYATADSEDSLSAETVLMSGSYFVAQTITGCDDESDRTEVAVTLAATPTPTTTNAQTYCNGTTIAMLMATPTEGATISWYATEDSPEALGNDAVLETGAYFVAQTLEGCISDRVEVAITINPVPDAPQGDAVQEFEVGDTVATLAITVSEGAVVTWYIQNDSEEFIEIDATTALEDGAEYYVSQTLTNCESELLIITATDLLSSTLFKDTVLQVYPNPATNTITVVNNSSIQSIALHNLLGQKILSQVVYNNTAQLDVTSLAAGTYLLNIHTENGATTSVKIIKQ